MANLIMRRGFSSMSPERRREVAAMGGRKSKRGPNRPIGEMLALRSQVKTGLQEP